MFQRIASALLFAQLCVPAAAQGGFIAGTCAAAGVLSLGANNIAFQSATLSPNTTPCNAGNVDGWLTFTPSTTDAYFFTLSGSSRDVPGTSFGIVGVYAGSCGALTPIACFPMGSPNPSPTTHCEVPLTGGAAYWIEIGFVLGATSITGLSMSVQALATNDECAGALPATLGETAVSIADATASVVPSCSMAKDEWYEFSPSCTRLYEVAFETSGFSALAVYDACGGNLLSCAPSGAPASVQLLLSAGANYRIQVGKPAAVNPLLLSIAETSGQLRISDPFDLEVSATPGFLSIGIRCGAPSGVYFTPVTFNAGAFPNGWFLGLDITWAELFAQWTTAPFVGVLDAQGNVANGPYAVPPGLTLYAVGVSDLFGPHWKASPPLSVTTI